MASWTDLSGNIPIFLERSRAMNCASDAIHVVPTSVASWVHNLWSIVVLYDATLVLCLEWCW